jgi:nickel/cobalt exporter
MIRRLALLILLLAGLSGMSAPAFAHPHVWVQLSAEIIYAPDGSATGVRHVWLFDDMYSTFATEPIKPKVPGQFTREELAPLAQENVDSLKDYDFFTYVKADGQALKFGKPENYWLTYKDQMLTLHFTLPFEKPVQAAQLLVEIYDPEFFIDFTLVEKEPFALTGAPAQCKFTVHKTDDPAAQGAQILPDAQAKQPDTMNFGAQFANRLSVECPTIAASLVGPVQAPSSGTPRAQSPSSRPSSGFVGWIIAKQEEFYRAMSATMRAAKADGSAVWGLLMLSFLYGVFHAAGPGHGKAVISSYLVANEETWWRGVVLSFASAFLQGLVAIALVGGIMVALNATKKFMCETEYYIGIASYALIALVGAWLLWVKGRSFSRALFALEQPLQAVGAAATPPHDHDHDHDLDHGHDHDHASAWGHSHGPEPAGLAGPGGWRRGLFAIVAVGVRPCSGAILVLVFALAQGLFWAGVASTFAMALGTAITVAVIATFAVAARSFASQVAVSRAGYGMLLMRGIEVAAAAVVLGFGALLLIGYLTAERLPAMACS